MIGELLRSQTYVTILKYIDLWGETLPETLFRGGPLVPVDVREVQGGVPGVPGGPVGHLFRTSAAVTCIDTYPAGSSVIANPELAQLTCRYFGEDIGERTDFLALCEMHS